MRKKIALPKEVIEAVRTIADQERFVEIQRICGQVTQDGIELGPEEAQSLVNFALYEKLKAEMKFPYWSDGHPLYRPDHEEAFQDIQMGLYEKVVSYVSSAFEVRI